MCSTSSPIKRKISLRKIRLRNDWIGPPCSHASEPASVFPLPKLQALYQVVKAEAGPETVVACSICSGKLIARDGQFVLKYFLLRKGIPRKQRP